MEIIPDLSLCLAYSGSPEQLHDFLAALVTTADPVACEAIVVYRASTPPPAELFRTHPAVLFFEERDDATAVAAMNQALRLAKGRYLSLWQDSIRLQPRTLYQLLTLLDDRPELGLIAPRLVTPDHTTLSNAGPLPSLFRHQPDGQIPAEQATPLPAAWLSGQALIFRREVLDDIGPLDNGFRAGYADADFCRRAASEGWRLALDPAAVAIDSTPADHPSPCAGDLARFLLRKWLASR
jgi:GT2 family glycosyltransferase